MTCGRPFFLNPVLASTLAPQDAPFFTVKLGVKVLPCVIFFRKGVAVDRVVGFDGLGATDDFETAALEDRMYHAEVGVVSCHLMHGQGMPSDDGSGQPGSCLRGPRVSYRDGLASMRHGVVTALYTMALHGGWRECGQPRKTGPGTHRGLAAS